MEQEASKTEEGKPASTDVDEKTENDTNIPLRKPQRLKEISASDCLRWCDICDAVLTAPLITKYVPDESIAWFILDYSFTFHWDPDMTFGMDLDEDKFEASHYLRKDKRDPNRKVYTRSGWQTSRGNLCLDDTYGFVYQWSITAVDFSTTGDIICGILNDKDLIKPSEEERLNEGYIDECEAWSYGSSNKYHPDPHGYICHQNSSRNYGSGRGNDVKFGERFAKGDTLTVIYDSKNQTLAFRVNNGKKLIPYEKCIVNDYIYPYVTVYGSTSCALLLQKSIKFSNG